MVQAFADLISSTYQIDEGRAKVLTMSVFGIVNWTFTWLKPGGSLTYPQYARPLWHSRGSLNGGRPYATYPQKPKPASGKHHV